MEQDLVVNVVLKGGAGSGFFGHQGRPGEEGGSAARVIMSSQSVVNNITEVNDLIKNLDDNGGGLYRETPHGRDYYFTAIPNINPGKITLLSNNNTKFTVKISELIRKVKIDEGVNKESINVILKGGAGSGFHGHKGRPGEVGGSLPEGAVAAKKIKEPKIANVTDENDVKNYKEELIRYADELGFPPDKIIFDNSGGSKFTVGDESYEQAASYNPKTGEIRLNTGSMTLAELTDANGIVTNFDKKLVAHEVMHDRFRKFEQQLHRQEALINKLATGLEDNPVLDDHYDLKPEFREQYWAVDIKQRYYQYVDQRELLYQIPVTNYGKSYVEVARTATYGLAISNALSENLAEVAAYSDSPNVFVSTRWSKLYNEINQSLYTHKLIPKYVPLVRSDNG